MEAAMEAEAATEAATEAAAPEAAAPEAAEPEEDDEEGDDEDDDDDEDYSNRSSAIDELESRVWQLEFVVRGKHADEKYDERGTRGGKQRERRFGETHGASVSRRSRTRTGVEIVLR